MKLSFKIYTNDLETVLKSAHRISNPNISRTPSSVKNGIDVIIHSLKLISNITTSEIISLGSGESFSVYVESIEGKENTFMSSVEILTKHLTLERPVIDENATAIDLVNIVMAYYNTLGGRHMYNGKMQYYVGMTEKNEESIKIVHKSPQFFTIIKNVGHDKALNAYQILLSKGYKGIELNEGQNLFSFREVT